MTITVTHDIQLLSPGAKVELFELDAVRLGGSVEYFHAGTDANRTPIVWQTHVYTPWPLEATGFDVSGKGQAASPRIKLSNIGGAMTVLVLAFQDLVGAKLTRRRTFARYLDGQPGADPTAGFPDDVFFVQRKVSENRVFVEWELSPPSDVEGLMLPKRQVLSNLCTWVYRSAECSYAGAAVATANDDPTSNLALDVCGKRLNSCKLRFGPTGPLKTSAFPAAGRR